MIKQKVQLKTKWVKVIKKVQLKNNYILNKVLLEKVQLNQGNPLWYKIQVPILKKFNLLLQILVIKELLN